MTNRWLESVITQARDGDDAAARALAGWMAECLERGQTPPQLLADYFAAMLRRAAKGQAVELVSGKHARMTRDFEVALAVWKLNHASDKMQQRESKRSGDGAFETVAAEYNVSAATVEAAYKRLRPLIDAHFAELTVPEKLAPEDIATRHQLDIDQALAFAKLAEAQANK